MVDGLTWMVGVAGLAAGFALGRRRAVRPAPTQPAASAAPAATSEVDTLLAHVTQAVMIVDGRDRLAVANPRARELLRLGDDVVGAPFVPLARSADLVDFVRLAREGEGSAREIELNRAPAANIWIRISGAPLPGPSAQARSVVLVAEDITRLRRLESLEREFVANVSHDLRTPVTILRGYAETLAQDHDALAPEERARFIAKIVSATGRLASLLEGMLALASLESGMAVRREPGALESAAAEAVDSLADRARAAGLRLRLEVAEAGGSADPTLARRLVQNLVENAIAHAQGATEVVIRVRGALLEVEDDGQGVAPADLARLFDRFYRTDRSRKQGGAGIGLSIVRQIAELHGGGVSAEAVRPRGLRIRVALAPA